MNAMHLKTLIYSSSATVYAPSQTENFILEKAFIETAPFGPINPYGQTKAMGEQIIKDWAAATLGTQSAILRYFNPVGAHPSGRRSAIMYMFVMLLMRIYVFSKT